MQRIRWIACLLFCFTLLGAILPTPSVVHMQAETDPCATIDIPEPSDNTKVTPNCTIPGREIQVEVSGLPPNEPVQLTYVWPGNRGCGAGAAFTTDGDGNYKRGIPTQGLPGGLWEVRLTQASTQALLARFYYVIIGEEGGEIITPPPTIMPYLVPTIPREEWDREMDPETYLTADQAIDKLNELGYFQIVIDANGDTTLPDNMVWATNPTPDQPIAECQTITLLVIRHPKNEGSGGGDLENP